MGHREKENKGRKKTGGKKTGRWKVRKREERGQKQGKETMN